MTTGWAATRTRSSVAMLPNPKRLSPLRAVVSPSQFTLRRGDSSRAPIGPTIPTRRRSRLSTLMGRRTIHSMTT